ncbi:calcium-binding protein [uncultured Tateyamaria sp.]|uniref:calcium-binding protein n=1 Tax=uncultured Tateyamaria sp. TaxID=455651 RepID=UPI00260F6741|nr:calcium-binding protein [uncultured Tateyamaria sp.]
MAAGDDILLTRSGTFSFPSPGSDTIEGGFGDDTIGFAPNGVGQSALGSNQVFDGGTTFFGAVGDTFVFETFGSDYDVVINGGSGGSFVKISSGTRIATLDRFDNVIAGEGDDVITNSSSLGTFFEGNGGNYSITRTGTTGYALSGGAGDDTIIGGASRDNIAGDDDNDSLSGGDGADTISAGNGNDTVNGGNGRDEVFLGNGNDLFNDNSQGGEVSRDTVFAGNGDDTIEGGNGDDSFNGGACSDLINARLGNDEVFWR